jgi:hypothetical protein
MAYLTGVSNYKTLDEAKRRFYELSSWVVLETHKDGSASIAFLQDEPMYQGQVEYKGGNHDA